MRSWQSLCVNCSGNIMTWRMAAWHNSDEESHSPVSRDRLRDFSTHLPLIVDIIGPPRRPQRVL